MQATFYVSHEWTDYSHVQDLYADGHEMASHTITHSHGTNFNEEKWANEVISLCARKIQGFTTFGQKIVNACMFLTHMYPSQKLSISKL